jgi:hypothetical protein
LSGHVTIFGQIEGPIAKIIEARLDDGAPDTGRVQAVDAAGTGTTPMAPAGTPATAYDDGKRYNMAFRL